jgi:hypothetical protein
MRAPRNQVFLERRSYRLRRLGDAARLLPVLGLILLLLPLFWAPQTTGQPRMTAGDGIYLFAIWVGLILLAGLLSRQLLQMAEAGRDDTGSDADPAAGTPFGDARTGE